MLLSGNPIHTPSRALVHTVQVASPQLIKTLDEKGGAGTNFDVTNLRLKWMDGAYKTMDEVEGHVMAYEKELARRCVLLACVRMCRCVCVCMRLGLCLCVCVHACGAGCECPTLP